MNFKSYFSLFESHHIIKIKLNLTNDSKQLFTYVQKFNKFFYFQINEQNYVTMSCKHLHNYIIINKYSRIQKLIAF